MLKTLSLIFVSCLNIPITAQAGEVYKVLEEYSEEKFKLKAIEKVLTTFVEKKLPLPHEQEDNKEYSDNFKNQCEIALIQYKDQWLQKAQERLAPLIQTRLNILDPLRDQLNLANCLCKKEDQDKVDKIMSFVFKKKDDLNYILNAYRMCCKKFYYLLLLITIEIKNGLKPQINFLKKTF